MSDLKKCLLAEINQLRDDLEYLESQYEDTKYLAEDLEKTTSKLDEDEFLDFFPLRLEKALEMIWNGQITDVKTIIGLLWLDKINRNKA